MKPLHTLLALVCFVSINGTVRAERVTTHLTREKTSDHLYSFTITVERQKDNSLGDYLEFRVMVKPKDSKATGLPRRSGTMEVFADKEFISSCEVQLTERDGELVYSFRVAVKYVERSKFIFAETIKQADDAQGFFYWFYLKDFVEPAPPAKKDAPPAQPDPITAAMRDALAKINKVHAGMEQKAIDDAVVELHREIARQDSKVFVPLAVPHLMRLAPHDTATRVLLRKALAEGWLGEFAARMYLVQAGDTPGPHVEAMLKAVGGTDQKARRAAIEALRGVGVAAADALPKLRGIIEAAKADPSDYRRAYTLQDEVPEHVLAYWAVIAIEAALKDRKDKPK